VGTSPTYCLGWRSAGTNPRRNQSGPLVWIEKRHAVRLAARAYSLPPAVTIEQALNAVGPAVDVLIGTTAEETRFFAVIDPTFNRVVRLPLLGTELVSLMTTVT
jgi:hypothetical protein